MSDERGKGGTGGAWLFGIVVGLILIALIIAAYSAGLDKGREEATPAPAGGARTGTTAAPASKGPGRQLFAAKCGTCHTLSAAGTSGKVGPNLDDLRPDATRVLAAIRDGGTGSGAMPKGLVTGRQAQQVADFVSGAAGG